MPVPWQGPIINNHNAKEQVSVCYKLAYGSRIHGRSRTLSPRDKAKNTKKRSR